MLPLDVIEFATKPDVVMRDIKVCPVLKLDPEPVEL